MNKQYLLDFSLPHLSALFSAELASLTGRFSLASGFWLLASGWPSEAKGKQFQRKESFSLYRVAASVVMNSCGASLGYMPTHEPFIVARKVGCSDWPDLSPVP